MTFLYYFFYAIGIVLVVAVLILYAILLLIWHLIGAAVRYVAKSI